MTSSKCYLACVATILCALFGRADAATDPLSNVNRLPASLETVAGRVSGKLTGSGYEVQRGYWALWGSGQCKYTVQVLGRCFGPNPTAPYALPFVPLWRDEYVDETLHNVFGPARPGYSPIYRLHQTEALVILAELPPPGAYLGLQTYVFTRQAEVNRKDEIFLGVPDDFRGLLFSTAPNPARLVTWATVGDSINQAVIEDQVGSPWESNQHRFFIVTPDQAIERDVSQALEAAGVARFHAEDERDPSPAIAPGAERGGLGGGEHGLALRHAGEGPLALVVDREDHADGVSHLPVERRWRGRWVEREVARDPHVERAGAGLSEQEGEQERGGHVFVSPSPRST